MQKQAKLSKMAKSGQILAKTTKNDRNQKKMDKNRQTQPKRSERWQKLAKNIIQKNEVKQAKIGKTGENW